MKFTPCPTGEALKWNVISTPPPLMMSLSAGIPLTVKSLGWTVPGSTGALISAIKSVNCAKTVLSQAGWEPFTEQGGSLGVGVTLGDTVAVGVAVGVDVGVVVAVAVAVAVAVGVGVGVPPAGTRKA